MRKLPVYIIVDTSRSMQGAPIAAVEEGIASLHRSLMTNPFAIEVASLSVITFSTEALQIVPLSELDEFQPPKLAAKGWSYLDKALVLVTERAGVEVRRTLPGAKGDWKPLVFIMTDGRPTVSLAESLRVFNSYQWGVVVACAAGPKGDTRTLSQITPNVVKLETVTPESIASYFKWVSQSVNATSQQANQNLPNPGAGGGANANSAFNALPPPPPEISIVKI